MKERYLKEFSPNNKNVYYSSGDRVLCSGTLMNGVDLASFKYFDNGFAKDCNHCYCMAHRLQGSDPASFQVLNYCYAKDKQFVWTFGGKLQSVDVSSFEVCDDGYRTISGNKPIPSGYGKDRFHVYFYGFQGKPKMLSGAIPETFIAIKNSGFGKDDQSVYFGSNRLTGAKSSAWKSLGGDYSKSENKVYHRNKRVKNAAVESFQVDPVVNTLAKDHGKFFSLDQELTEREYESFRSSLVSLVR